MPRAEDSYMLHGMPLPRALRLLGYALCALIAAPEALGWITRRESAHGAAWLACYAAFVGGFHVGASSLGGARGVLRRASAIAAQVAAMIAMAIVAPCQFAALALVVLALQAALLLSPLRVVAALALQTVVVSTLVMRGCGAAQSASWLLAMCGFQAAAAVAVLIARRELHARTELARANSELCATRALLAESSRAEERQRIARELHDVLGHNLTALGLQLEVARNVPPEAAAEHVAKARALADEALSGVRGAVSAMRSAGGPDMGRALRALADGAPGLAVHLDTPEPFVVDCAERAHCLVRCVQEIITNALRHAGAENLWITIARDKERITVDAHDDGRGASELRSGNGLSGMRTRIERMGGQLAIEPTPTFSLRASLPIEGAS
jgi:signal transduction histidine kinase